MANFLKEYTLLGELGSGGFAKVYKVRHNELGYIRAIRVLNEPVANENSRTYQKFLRECRVLLRLGNGNHKNIVHIYQPRLLENHALVEMDYIDGMDLPHYLKANDNFLPAQEIINMVEEISDALAYCHEDIYRFCMNPDEDNLKNDPIDGSKYLIDNITKKHLIEKYKVIHNDIHSGNIMRRDDGTFVLLDFGLAITGDDDVRHSSRHEHGAAEFKAPEKWDDEALLTEQSDVYSFGVVMYEYLAGHVPFPFDKKLSNKTEAEYKLNQAHKKELPPSIFNIRKSYYESKYKGKLYEKDYPDWLEVAIMKCLEKDSAKRFKNGKELHDFIIKHMEEETKPQLQEKINLLNTTIKNNEKTIIDLKTQIEKLEQDQLSTQNDIYIVELNKRIYKLEKENDILSEEKIDLSKQLDILKRKNDSLQSEINLFNDHPIKGSKTRFIVLCIIFVFLTFVFGGLYFNLNRECTNLKVSNKKIENEYKTARSILNEVEENLQAIRDAEGILFMSNYDDERDQIISEILQLREVLAVNRARMDSLGDNGYQANKNNANLRAQIKKLQAQLAEQEEAYNNLQILEANLERSNKEKQKEIDALRKKLGL